MSESIEASIDWEKMDGVVPAVVQHAETLQVLMLGYMTREALEQTEATGRVTFYSRSKKRLWQKGETSGNHLRLVSTDVDCDGDALLVRARPAGPTCHRGTTSCFGDANAPGLGFLGRLGGIVRERAASGGSQSYTRTLLESGVRRVAQKLGEEGVEVALAGAGGTGDELLEEAADLVFHLLVLLCAREAELGDVVEVLRRRHATRR